MPRAALVEVPRQASYQCPEVEQAAAHGSMKPGDKLVCSKSTETKWLELYQDQTSVDLRQMVYKLNYACGAAHLCL